MTPGFAKPRSELPWLPYEEQDKVLINAHRFNTAWTPAVNGKMPVAAWVPSRDTAGNGTTTLTDLVGGNNGTLTNMDAATDWVADTDAGGVRALDFDGVNDYVAATTNGSAYSQLSLSVWMRKAASGNVSIISMGSEAFPNRTHLNWYSDSQVYLVTEDGGSVYGQFSFPFAAGWHHFVMIFDGTTSGNSNRLKLWIDGTQRTLTFFGGIPTTIVSSSAVAIGRGYSIFYTTGRIDDFRLFGVPLDVSDVASLYKGRGVQA
jgi:hypothetical protein